MSLLQRLAVFALYATSSVLAQSSGYVGYELSLEGDQDSVIYSTLNTRAEAENIPDPDVFLNASVYVGEIDIQVDNLTAKINLDAQVLNLLQFNAGVDLSIDSVSLLIQNVTARVLLEARLENLVAMISSVLDSIDLNPVIATLTEGVGEIVNDTVGGLTGNGGSLNSRGLDLDSFEFTKGILYSTNDYQGNTHHNRVLAQNGDILDQVLDNNGDVQSQSVAGNFATDMTPIDLGGNGSREIVRNGQTVTEREYLYAPFPGLEVFVYIYFDASGGVAGTQVFSEIEGGGSSTISDL